MEEDSQWKMQIFVVYDKPAASSQLPLYLVKLACTTPSIKL
jgi:hypothetical protein